MRHKSRVFSLPAFDLPIFFGGTTAFLATYFVFEEAEDVFFFKDLSEIFFDNFLGMGELDFLESLGEAAVSFIFLAILSC